MSQVSDSNRLRALVASLRAFALRAKSSLDAEIRSYPTPIPRCDAQFNHAYEQRSRLAGLLQRIDMEASDAEGASGRLRAMAEFAALPPIDESIEERTLRERVAAELARAGVPIGADAERGSVDLTNAR
jgi:hypothetical protein